MSIRVKARRTIGRPSQIHRSDARGDLLDAAVRLFAGKGVAGTTVAEIALHAQVTAAMVHYYFTNRDQLVDAVAVERLGPIVTGVWAPVLESQQVGPMLAGLVQRIFSATEEHSWLPSLWLREVISDGGHLRTRLLKIVPVAYVQHLIGTVRAAQKQGGISRDLDARLVPASLLGLTLLPLASIALFEQMPALRGIHKRDIARHAQALVVGAFTERPPRAPKAR